MSTPKQYWRLLEPEVDVWQERDECLTEKGWRAISMGAVGDICHSHEAQGRRRITLPEPQGWISVKERMPTKEDANKQGMVLWFRHDGGHKYPQPGALNLYGDWFTHWTTIPDDPDPEKDLDEEAFKQWWGNTPVGDRELAKRTFLAGRKSVATEGGAK